jgi:4-diphosphocytidyl-2-C-methyl-D-erythritol kinase
MFVKAPAKINLYLKVLRSRPDGYHDIYSIMQKVSLYDYIHFHLYSRGIIVETDNPSIPSGRENIAFRAAELFFRHTGIKKGIKIFINKNIPSGAGLGGGSSDAGAVLKILNYLFGTNISIKKLIELATEVGSDVPFFVFPSVSAVAEGRGEILRPLRIPRKWYLLVNPGFHISTAWAFNKIDKVKNILTNCKNSFKISNLNKRSIFNGLSNDLEDVSMKEYPVLKEIKSALRKLGAIDSVMSGSGSTVVGIFDSEDEAKKAQSRMPSNYWIRVVRGL